MKILSSIGIGVAIVLISRIIIEKMAPEPTEIVPTLANEQDTETELGIYV